MYKFSLVYLINVLIRCFFPGFFFLCLIFYQANFCTITRTLILIIVVLLFTKFERQQCLWLVAWLLHLQAIRCCEKKVGRTIELPNFFQVNIFLCGLVLYFSHLCIIAGSYILLLWKGICFCDVQGGLCSSTSRIENSRKVVLLKTSAYTSHKNLHFVVLFSLLVFFFNSYLIWLGAWVGHSVGSIASVIPLVVYAQRELPRGKKLLQQTVHPFSKNLRIFLA